MEKALSHPSQAEAVVFDVDGVLINSWMSIMTQGCELIKRYRGTAARDDYQRVHRANVYSGDPALNIPYMLELDEETWENESEAIYAMHAEIFQKYRSAMFTYPGALRLLDAVKRDKKVAALTTRDRTMFCSDICPDLLPVDDYNRYFDVVVTKSDVTHPKPHPEGFLKIADRLDTPPDRMVMIGDMPTDMAFVGPLGALGIGITQFPFADADILRNAGADYVVDSLDGARKLLLEPKLEE